MGIGNWVRKAGSWISDKFHKGVNLVQRVSKFAMPILDRVQQLVPGRIGAIAGAGRGILNAASGFISALPNGGLKDKLSGLAQRGNNFIDNVQGQSQKNWNKVSGHIDTGRGIYNAGKDAVNQVSGIADRLKG
jgi:hypothetical protein